jgi:hypothetical protein
MSGGINTSDSMAHRLLMQLSIRRREMSAREGNDVAPSKERVVEGTPLTAPVDFSELIECPVGGDPCGPLPDVTPLPSGPALGGSV